MAATSLSSMAPVTLSRATIMPVQRSAAVASFSGRPLSSRGLGLALPSRRVSRRSAAVVVAPRAMAAADDDDDEAPEEFGTRGGDRTDFDWGHEDGHHTFKKGGDTLTKWKSYVDDSIESAGGPSGPQFFLAAVSLPALLIGGALQVNADVLLIGTAALSVMYCAAEIAASWPEAMAEKSRREAASK